MTNEELKIQIALGTAPRITLSDIKGEYILDAVDFNVIKSDNASYADANVIRFRLDGIVYIATEDPEDGYRSCLSTIERDLCEISNVFLPTKVVVKQYLDNSDCGDECCDTIELVDIITKEVVLRVGTDLSDSYYPTFVSEFIPEAMSSNRF